MTAARPFIDWTVTPAGIAALTICTLGAAAGLAVLAACRAHRNTLPTPPPPADAYREGAIAAEHTARLRSELTRAAAGRTPVEAIDDDVVEWAKARRREARRGQGGTMPEASADRPPLVDLARVAEHLGTTERHVRDLIARNGLPHVKVGRLLRFRIGDVDAWLDQPREP